MGRWQIYYRDFATVPSRRLRMAQGSIADLTPRQYSELLSGPMQVFEVGKEKRRFLVHRHLLCHHSEALESELTGDGKKRADVVDLGEYPVEAFELFLRWVYTGKLDDVSDIFEPHDRYNYAISNHGLYRLCERFDMPQLKNIAMDQCRRGFFLSELVPDPEELAVIYAQNPPSGSPWRRLMTKIAARQIMDPESDRDAGAFRVCFSDPAFAIDLVNAIKQGTGGGILFDDPTDSEIEDPCLYHDHEGANCHIKGKGKIKAFKTTARLHSDIRLPNSAAPEKSSSSLSPALQALDPNPKPPPRQARLQDESGTGPLRRRLTSPASSTIEISTQIAVADPYSPKEKDHKFRKVPAQESNPDDHPRSSDAESRQRTDSSPSSDRNDRSGRRAKADVPANKATQVAEDTSPRRGLWKWARLETGKMGIIGRRPQIEWKAPSVVTSKAANSAVNGALERGRPMDGSGSLDDFSLASSTSTDPGNEAQRSEASAAKIKGLGIPGTAADPSLFSQTKRSSDDLVASANETPSPAALRNSESTLYGSKASPPATPSPLPRRKGTEGSNPENTHGPRRIPKCKIALGSNVLSPTKTPAS